MGAYFAELESIRYRFGDDDRAMLRTLAERYVGANPPAPFAFRAFQRGGVLQTADGLYDLNLAEKLPEAQEGQYAYGFGLVWSDGERSLDLLLRCLGPVRLYCNGELAYVSNVIDELQPDAEVKLNVQFRPGWNKLWLRAVKTAAGFGCRIGADEAKVRILQVLAPFRERTGQAGWAFSQPTGLALEAGAITGEEAEAATGLVWYPRREWSEEERRLPALERMFGPQRQGRGKLAYAWTRLLVPEDAGSRVCRLRMSASGGGALAVWLRGQLVAECGGDRGQKEERAAAGCRSEPMERASADHGGEQDSRPMGDDRGRVLEQQGAGARSDDNGGVPEPTAPVWECELELPQGRTFELLVRSECGGSGPWGFALTASIGGRECAWSLPRAVHGGCGSWLYVGPFAAEADPGPERVASMRRPFALQAGPGARTYWRFDAPELYVRPYYENAMLSNKWTTSGVTNFARWDYPLGVTMYGLLRTGRELGRPDWTEYALQHIRACTGMYEYSLWDRDEYGFPAINHQLVLIRMLDNCGSFGSAMLEGTREVRDPEAAAIAARIVDFMMHTLERREDGAFYRQCPGEYSADTMWADDLYMSTPFLCRYSALTGDSCYIDEAARQFRLFRSYLYMPEQRIMSHVYDFKYGQQTGIPWGRGNGWVLFSLSELLEALPEAHAERPFLLEWFCDLCRGYAALQAESGLWHQVLNRQDAYEEASCTAMFAYAFARGVRFGWLPANERGRFAQAALRAWQELTRAAIDRHGNVHGVCSGSRYSFAADYYMYDLRTVVNDNHGIGIMMLAGCEIVKLQEWLETAPL